MLHYSDPPLPPTHTPPPPSPTSLALVVTSMYCVDWQNAQWFESDSSIQVNVTFHVSLQPVCIFCHQSMHTVAYLESFIRSPLLFCSVPTLSAYEINTALPSGFFVQDFICDILIGSSCSCDWQPSSIWLCSLEWSPLVLVFCPLTP